MSLWLRYANNRSTLVHPRLKKAWTVPSAGMVMALFIWDAIGILMVDYLQKGQTINDTYSWVKVLNFHNPELLKIKSSNLQNAYKYQQSQV